MALFSTRHVAPLNKHIGRQDGPRKTEGGCFAPNHLVTDPLYTNQQSIHLISYMPKVSPSSHHFPPKPQNWSTQGLQVLTVYIYAMHTTLDALHAICPLYTVYNEWFFVCIVNIVHWVQRVHCLKSIRCLQLIQWVNTPYSVHFANIVSSTR